MLDCCAVLRQTLLPRGASAKPRLSAAVSHACCHRRSRITCSCTYSLFYRHHRYHRRCHRASLVERSPPLPPRPTLVTCVRSTETVAECPGGPSCFTAPGRGTCKIVAGPCGVWRRELRAALYLSQLLAPRGPSTLSRWLASGQPPACIGPTDTGQPPASSRSKRSRSGAGGKRSPGTHGALTRSWPAGPERSHVGQFVAGLDGCSRYADQGTCRGRVPFGRVEQNAEAGTAARAASTCHWIECGAGYSDYRLIQFH